MPTNAPVYEQDIRSLYAKLAAQYVIPQRCLDDPNIKHALLPATCFTVAMWLPRLRVAIYTTS